MLAGNPGFKSITGATRRAARAAVMAITVVAVACSAAGCRKKPAPPVRTDEAIFQDIARAQVRADEVFNGRDTMKIARGKWSTPGSVSGYEAYRAGEVFRFIEEREDRGDYGSSDNRYYYGETGILFFYEDRGEEKEPRGSLPPMSRLIQRTLMFGDSGQAVWGRRLVDGASGQVPDSQIVAIRDRANGLLAHLKGMAP